MLARRARDVLVGIAAQPGGPVDVIAVPSDGRRLRLGSVRAGVNARPLLALRSPCGWNCFRLDASGLMKGTAASVRVEVEDRRRKLRAIFALPAAPPPAATRLLRRVNGRMDGLRTVRVDETLSNGSSLLTSRFAFQEPDRMSYVSSNGARAVVVGRRRWDSFRGRWEMSTIDPIRSPAYIWARAGRARLIAQERRGNRLLRVIAAFQPDERFPAWFRLFVDRGDRVLEAEMLAPAHFMRDRFHAFNASFVIRPPR